MPKSEAEQHKLRVVEQARREGYARVEVWVTEALPAELRRGVVISVQEVSCSDPECCPIDTAVGECPRLLVSFFTRSNSILGRSNIVCFWRQGTHWHTS